jgi:hypothetical protein
MIEAQRKVWQIIKSPPFAAADVARAHFGMDHPRISFKSYVSRLKGHYAIRMLLVK